MPRSGRPPNVTACAAKSALLAFAFLSLLSAAAGEYFPDIHFSGACDAKNFLNGLRFAYQGHARNGAPYYKATTRNEYIYWDPDCGGGGDGQPRWIVDEHEPDPTVLRDLDGDGFCNYHARLDSADRDLPPMSGFWYMGCGADEAPAEKRFIVLADITTTSTTTKTTTTSSTATTTTTSTVTSTTTTTVSSTSTTVSTTTTTSQTSTTTTTTRTSTTRTSTTSTLTTTSTTTTSNTTTTTTKTTTTTSMTSTTVTGTSVTKTSTTTTTTLMEFKLTGACEYKDFLNGLTFLEAGRSASGARYFKAVEADQYMYHDVDCNGGNDGKKRWIIDDSEPNVSRMHDLDQDGACNYHARVDSSDTEHPPVAATWKMHCGLDWVDAVLRLDDARNHTFDDGLDESQSLQLSGVLSECPQKEFLDGVQFDFQGTTASGAPFYKSAESSQYLYYDPHCSGSILSAPRWVIDEDRPSTEAESDLDADGNCSYHARVKSSDGASPPKGALWHIECGGVWKDLWLALKRLPMTSTTTLYSTTTPMTPTTMMSTTQATPTSQTSIPGTGVDGEVTTTISRVTVVNGVAGPQPFLVALLAGGFALLFSLP